MKGTIRVFISSRFTNFDEIRNGLVSKTFPKIKKYCEENGFSFHVVDLRWGVTEDEKRNFQTAEICFEEIRRCQEYSPSPNFIVLSDDTYRGWIPIPSSISSNDWKRIEAYLQKRDPVSLEFLGIWYRKDLNDLSGSYHLQNILRRTIDSGIETVHLDAAMEENIGSILFPAGQAVFNREEDYSTRVAFGGSMTEQEINLGLFSCKGANQHTLVIINEGGCGQGNAENGRHPDNTSSPKHPECGSESGNGSLSFNAHNLNEHLKREIENAGNEWIPYDEVTYTDKAEKFLKKVIEKRIDKEKEEEKKETAFDRECRELREALSKEAEEYVDVGGRLEGLLQLLAENKGRAALVRGEQGSGKSTLLKYYAKNHPDQCFGVFTDIQEGRNTLDAALDFLIKALHKRGLLDAVLHRDWHEGCVGYFERQLGRLNKDDEIVLVLDCAEGIADLKLQEKSLFSLKLPANATLLVSCADERSLSGRDVSYNPPSFFLKGIESGEAFSMLLGMLGKIGDKGRTLSKWQGERVKSALPSEVTPLYLRLFADLLRYVPAYGDSPASAQRAISEEGEQIWSFLMDDPLPGDARLLAIKILKRHIQTHFPSLYLHALVCIALSSQGMQEEELVEILFRITKKVSGLRAEIKDNSWQKNKNMEHAPMNDVIMKHVLNVLWSRMYFQLQHFLEFFPSHGMLLVRFRHGLIREAALDLCRQGIQSENGCGETPSGEGGRIPDDPDLLDETSEILRDFWMHQKPYIFTEASATDGKTSQTTSQTASQATSQTASQATSQAISQTASQATSQTASTASSQTESQATSQTASLAITQLASQAIPQTESQAISQRERSKSEIRSKTGSVIVNRRRADELMPILQYRIKMLLERKKMPLYRKEMDMAGELLENSEYIDAMIRLGRCGTAMDQIEAAINVGYAGSRAKKFLDLLKDYEILLTSFSDTFLPLCAQHGMIENYGPIAHEALKRKGIAGYFPYSAEKKGLQEDPKLLVLGSADAPMALRGDGMMATMGRGNIFIYDWNRRRYSTAVFPIEWKLGDFLCWKDDLLVLRRYKVRICFRFIREEGTDEELIQERKEPCPNLLDFFDNKEEKRRAAGDIQEEDAASVLTDRKPHYYLPDGQCRTRTLEYPLNKRIEYYRRLNQAAIVVDRETVDFVDLDAGVVRETLRIPNVTGVFYSDDGKSVLIRTREENVILHRITDRYVHPMPVWPDGAKSFEKAKKRYSLRKNLSAGIVFAIRRKGDIPWQPMGVPVEGMEFPVLTCMSIKRGWYACYYNYNNISMVRIFDLKTGTELLSSEVEPIFRKDMDEDMPFRVEEGGTKLVVVSSGIRHVLNLELNPPTWETVRNGCDVPGAVEKNLLADCREHMRRWLPQSHAYESLDDMTDHTIDTILGRIIARTWRIVFSPITYALNPEKTINPDETLPVQMIRTEQYLWIVDYRFRMVHLADADGRWLCHMQTEDAFVAADAEGDRLFLMPGDRNLVLEMRYVRL